MGDLMVNCTHKIIVVGKHGIRKAIPGPLQNPDIHEAFLLRADAVNNMFLHCEHVDIVIGRSTPAMCVILIVCSDNSKIDGLVIFRAWRQNFRPELTGAGHVSFLGGRQCPWRNLLGVGRKKLSLVGKFKFKEVLGIGSLAVHGGKCLGVRKSKEQAQTQNCGNQKFSAMPKGTLRFYGHRSSFI